MSDLPPHTSSYVLSRIYAQGWNAGKEMLASGKAEVSSASATVRNPYATPEEQARWMKGFTDSFESRAGPFTTPGGNSWRGPPSRTKARIS
jgi:hypothetical protein